MSSKIFETQLYINNYKSNVLQELIAFGVSDLNIKSIDNWQYENETQINKLADVEKYVNNRKIAVIEGKYKDLNCGCSICKTADECYEYDIWVPTEIDSALDDECVSERNCYVYDAVVRMLKKYVQPHELIFCVNGIEMFVEFDNDLNRMLDNSSGIIQMICLCDTKMINNLSHKVRHDGEYKIIRLYSNI